MMKKSLLIQYGLAHAASYVLAFIATAIRTRTNCSYCWVNTSWYSCLSIMLIIILFL